MTFWFPRATRSCASGDTAAAAEHSARPCDTRPRDTASAERRVARDGYAYTYEQFAQYYRHDAERMWNASIASPNPQPEDCPTGVATEHAQEPPPVPPAQVLLRPEDIEQLCEAERSCRSTRPKNCPTGAATEHTPEPPPAPAAQVLLYSEDIEQLREAERSIAPRRSLQRLARMALEEITKAGPNSSMDKNLEHMFPWRAYVACHADARAIIGSGIALAMAEFIDDTKDANRGGQARLDFVFYRVDGSYCRLHPGSKKRGDAKPIFLPSPARDLATEHTSTPNDLSSLPASPYTWEHAALVPQIDRMGKADAYRSLQQTPCGALMPEGAYFKWWLFICNLGKVARETIGCGIVAATLENKWEGGVQLLLKRSDNTEAKLQILQQPHGSYITRLL